MNPLNNRLPWAETQAGLQAAYNAGLSDGQRATQHANLGLATTAELLDELRTRIEIEIDYSTVDARMDAHIIRAALS